MRLTNSVILAFLFTASIAFSKSAKAGEGSSVGNGGDVVVCRDSQQTILSVELLDFYEARVLRNLKLDLGSANLTTEQKLEYVTARWDRLDQNFVTYEVRYDGREFLKDAKYLSGVKLTDVPDSQHIAIPANCSIEQVAIQKTPDFPEESIFTVNKDLWDRMNADNQAGLVLHEVIYRYMLSHRKSTTTISSSVATRYLAGYASSERFATMSLPEYFELLNRLQHFDSVAVHYNRYLVDHPIVLFPNGQVSFGWVSGTYHKAIQIGGYCGTEIQNAATASHYENGMPELVTARPVGRRPAVVQGALLGDSCMSYYGSVKANFDFLFHPSGWLTGGFLLAPGQILVGKVKIELAPTSPIIYSPTKFGYFYERTGLPVTDDDVTFFPSGTLRSGILNRNVKLPDSQNKTALYKKGTKLFFNEVGQVVGGQSKIP
jgi:hypothetical protein